MKDFVLDESQLDFARALGADAVLLIAAALDDESLSRLHTGAAARGLAALVEAHDEGEIHRAAAVGARLVGVNARDLGTFDVDLPGMARLGALLPPGTARVAESGIRTRGDVEGLSAAGYGAFLVGETLLRSEDPARALRLLRGESTTEIKICGVTREEDVDACLGCGVDWIGLIFASRSPRCLSPERGRALRMRAKGEPGAGGGGGAVKGVVAVFAEGTPVEEIERVASLVRPDAIQMPEPPAALKRRLPTVRAVWDTVRVGHDVLAEVGGRAADALLFDTSIAGRSGGTGQTFNWNVLELVERTRPLVLAGGLTPANVADAVRTVKPDVVDVSSGVESAPAKKDAAKIAAFVRQVRDA
jgi:phosphoribosylanthranilate isomerase